MKKFTITLVAALVAVISWAQPTAIKSRQQLPEQYVAKSAAALKMIPEKAEKSPRLSPTMKVQAPALKASMKKAPAKVKKVADLNDLATTYMVKNYEFELENIGTQEEPDYQLVPATIARTVQEWEFVLVAPETFTLGITGIDGGETTVTATVNTEDGTITIPYGQAVGTTSYGTIAIASATGEENLVGVIDGDHILFMDYWYTELIDGDYAGYAWSNIYASEAVLPNGKMTFVDEGNIAEVDVAIDFDEESHVATVWNFGDMGVAVDVNLKAGGKFIIKPQLVESSRQYGDFYTCAISDQQERIDIITGTGTENSLTFDSDWTFYASTGYWYGQLGAATITWDGTFVYPVLIETPTTPATPEVVAFSPWDDEQGFASVTVNIPSVDVDSNDILTSQLSYQLLTQDAEGNTVALGTPIAYDNEENGTGDKKTIQLGEEAKTLTVIGVKSIYTAKGETNESGIGWFKIPEFVTAPEGLELKEYPVKAEAYGNSGWYTYEGTVLVGIDGEDIYIKGILPQFPGSWCKGTISGNTVTIPSMQCMGSFSGVFVYLTGALITQNSTVNPIDITFTYNASEDLYISQDLILGNVGNEEIGNVVLPYFDGMTIGTEVVPELVELPEGAEAVQYPFVGHTYENNGITEFESVVNVAVVNDDVYIQGINKYAPEVWVKGTKAEDGNIIFPSGQNFGLVEEEDYYGDPYTTQYFFVGVNAATNEIEDVVMTYNAEEDYYELQNEMLINIKKFSIYYDTWFMSGTTVGQKKTTVATFDFNALGTEDDPWPVSTTVSTDGDITKDAVLTEQTISLTISPAEEGKTANRYWNTKNGPQLRVYSGTLTFTTTDGTPITKIDFSKNSKWNEGNSADSGEFDGAVWTGNAQTVVVTIAGNTQIDAITVTSALKLLPALIETTTPEDLETADWKLEATEIIYNEEETDEETGEVITEASFNPETYTNTIQVGFYTAEGEEGTDVYIQGLCPELPKAWVKAPLVNGKVTFPYSTYFGEKEYLDWNTMSLVTDQLFLTSVEQIDEEGHYALADVVFDYDAEAGKLSTEQTIFINADRRSLSYYHRYEGMTITRIPDMAATPADPEIPADGLQVVDVMYPKLKPIVKTVDVDGNELLTSKLAYTIWIEKDGKEQQLTFTTDLYESLEEDMTEIPYEFGDGWDIYAKAETIYFNQSEEEIASWSKVGIQTIYYGGGERNTSNIVWADNPAYNFVDAIADINAVTSKATVVFDLQGRKIENSKFVNSKWNKGLYIVNGKKTVMK